jgi:hypothetical protein
MSKHHVTKACKGGEISPTVACRSLRNPLNGGDLWILKFQCWRETPRSLHNTILCVQPIHLLLLLYRHKCNFPIKPSPWIPNRYSLGQEVYPPFMKPEAAILCSQESVSGFKYEPEESNLSPRAASSTSILVISCHLNLASEASLPFRFADTFCVHFSCSPCTLLALLI